MGVVSSIVVFAVGAIMRFAITVNSTHFNIRTIGVTLMIVGGVGFIVSLIFCSSWGGFGGYRRQRTVTQARTATTGRSVRRSSSGRRGPPVSAGRPALRRVAVP